jgi:hypothetical protein
LISCIRNPTTIDSLIQDTITVLSQELEIPIDNTNNFKSAFKQIHIQQRIPLGIITSATLAPFEKYSDKTKYAPFIHHLIIKSIYEEIWIPSRQIQHSDIFPNPTPLVITNTSVSNLVSPSYIIEKLKQYINIGRKSLLLIYED